MKSRKRCVTGNKSYYRTANRKLMLRVLADESPCSARRIQNVLTEAFELKAWRMAILPSMIQTCRTLRDLTESGIINRQKQGNVYQYTRR